MGPGLFAFPKIVLCPECGREIVLRGCETGRLGGSRTAAPSVSAAPRGLTDPWCPEPSNPQQELLDFRSSRLVLWSSEPPCFSRSFSSWLSRRNHFPDPGCADLQSEMQPGTSRYRSRCLRFVGRRQKHAGFAGCPVVVLLFRERKNPPELPNFLL